MVYGCVGLLGGSWKCIFVRLLEGETGTLNSINDGILRMPRKWGRMVGMESKQVWDADHAGHLRNFVPNVLSMFNHR